MYDTVNICSDGRANRDFAHAVPPKNFPGERAICFIYDRKGGQTHIFTYYKG
jgi:hypothetical protein